MIVFFFTRSYFSVFFLPESNEIHTAPPIPRASSIYLHQSLCPPVVATDRYIPTVALPPVSISALTYEGRTRDRNVGQLSRSQ